MITFGVTNHLADGPATVALSAIVTCDKLPQWHIQRLSGEVASLNFTLPYSGGQEVSLMGDPGEILDTLSAAMATVDEYVRQERGVSRGL